MTSSPPESSCLAIDDFFSLLGGQLAEAERSQAVQHLERCPDCQCLLAEAVVGLEPNLQFELGNLPSVGALVAGRYRIERFVARGGMGDIYEARDEMLGETVALKTITMAAASAPNAIERLKAEVKLSRRVGHPHTCRIYDFGEHEVEGKVPIHFLTMEFVHGQTLGALLRSTGRLPEQRVLCITRQLLEGLATAHRVRVLHRDFKSDNVMLRAASLQGQSDDAVIMDFGLACALHDEADRLTSHTQALMGSAAYMAPEQVEGSTLTEAADIYALGIVLFEMLTGTLPFRGGSPIATALLRLRRAAPKPSSVVPELDPAWDDLVLGCLERSTAARYTSERALADLGAIGAERRSPVHKRRKRVGQMSGLIAGGFAILMLTLLLSARGGAPSPSPVPVTVPVDSVVESAEPMPEATPSLEQLALTLEAADAYASLWERAADAVACDKAIRLYQRRLDAAPASTAEGARARAAIQKLGTCVPAVVEKLAPKALRKPAKVDRAPPVDPSTQQPTDDPFATLPMADPSEAPPELQAPSASKRK